ncbi:calpain-7-like, partial [Saccostrea cucullata]|uniref:calpain-7-like n=1 Tax=Saccostrea cuccullata TaxID=36930 RepID=UPI002ED4E5FA
LRTSLRESRCLRRSCWSRSGSNFLRSTRPCLRTPVVTTTPRERNANRNINDPDPDLQYSVGFEVTCVSENVPGAPGQFKRTSSGDYRNSYCVLQLDRISGGIYNIMPSTFLPGQEGPFFLDISSSSPVTVAQI